MLGGSVGALVWAPEAPAIVTPPARIRGLTSDFQSVIDRLPRTWPKDPELRAAIPFADSAREYANCYSYAMKLTNFAPCLQPGVISASTARNAGTESFFAETNRLSRHPNGLAAYAELIVDGLIRDGAEPTGYDLRFAPGKYPIAVVFKHAADLSRDEKMGITAPENDFHFFRVSQFLTSGNRLLDALEIHQDQQQLAWSYLLPNKDIPAILKKNRQAAQGFTEPVAELFRESSHLNSHYFGGFFLVDTKKTAALIDAIDYSHNESTLRSSGFAIPEPKI